MELSSGIKREVSGSFAAGLGVSKIKAHLHEGPGRGAVWESDAHESYGVFINSYDYIIIIHQLQ